MKATSTESGQCLLLLCGATDTRGDTDPVPHTAGTALHSPGFGMTMLTTTALVLPPLETVVDCDCDAMLLMPNANELRAQRVSPKSSEAVPLTQS